MGGPVCSCKNEKQTAHCKGSNLQLITYGQDRQCCCPCNRQPPSELQYSIQGYKRAVVRRADKCSNKSKHRTNRHCIPHADQAANPYTSECEDQRKRQANLGRNSRQVKRFGSPFQAACRRLTLSVTSLCVRKDPSLLGGSAGFKPVLTLKTYIGRSFQLLRQNNCRSSRYWLRKKIPPRMPKI